MFIISPIGSVPSLPHHISTNLVISGKRIDHSATQGSRRQALILIHSFFCLVWKCIHYVYIICTVLFDISCRMVISLGKETRIGAIVRYWFVDSKSSIAQDAFPIVSASVVGRGAVLRALTTSAVGMRWILTLQPTHLHVWHINLTNS